MDSSTNKEMDADMLNSLLKLQIVDLKTMSGSRTQKREEFLQWEEYFLAVAFLSAMRSKDPVSQVGACIVNPLNRIVSIGYNGMPTGCGDNLLPWGKTSSDPLETKYPYVCHAEMNAIMNKNSSDVSGCTIYVALFPCNECAKIIVQSRIKEVVYHSDKHAKKASTIASKFLLKMAGINFRQSVSRPSVHLSFQMEKDLHTFTKCNQAVGFNVDAKRPDYISWEEYFMAVAFLSAQRSKDPTLQVGACIASENNIIVGIGYNGMPYGSNDDDMPWEDNNDLNFFNKSMYMCHAEMNAILNKNSTDLKGCRLYVTRFPCNECAKLIIQSGIKKVIYYDELCVSTIAAQATRKMFDLVAIEYRKYTGNLSEIHIDFDAINKSGGLLV